MKLSVAFNALYEGISATAIVADDSMTTEDMKNIIFRITPKGVTLTGINQMVVFTQELESGSYTVEAEEGELSDGGEFTMQVKCKEVLGWLNAFKSLSKTVAKNVIFETDKNKLRVTVEEEDTETGKLMTSRYVVDNLAIKPNLKADLALSFEDDKSSPMEIASLQLYTANLLPIMQSSGSGLYSKLIFGEDKVVSFHASFTALMNNILGDAFKGINCSNRAVSFIKDVVCTAEEPSVQVYRTDMHICFKSMTWVAFVKYEKKIPEYRNYLNAFKTEYGVVLDRCYFRDVLKRLSLGSDNVEFNINGSTGQVFVKNSKFCQELPVINTKGLETLGDIRFKIMPDVMNKMVIGNDSIFSPTVFMYINPLANGTYTLAISDDTGQWFSTATIR